MIVNRRLRQFINHLKRWHLSCRVYVKENKYSGIPMSEKSLKEYEQTWKDMEECFELLEKE